MLSLNEARRLLDRGKLYSSLASIIIIITILYLLDAGMSPSIHKHLRCGVASTYNFSMKGIVEIKGRIPAVNCTSRSTKTHPPNM